MSKQLKGLGIVLAGALMVGCGGMEPQELQGEEAGAPTEAGVGQVQGAVELARIGANETRDFSTWLFGTTTWRVYNPSSVAVPFLVWCGSTTYNGIVNPGQAQQQSWPCGAPGTRLYIRNNGTNASTQFIDVQTS